MSPQRKQSMKEPVMTQRIPEDWVGKEITFAVRDAMPSQARGVLERVENNGIVVRQQWVTEIRSKTEGSSEWTNEGRSVSEPRSEFFAWDDIGPVSLSNSL